MRATPSDPGLDRRLLALLLVLGAVYQVAAVLDLSRSPVFGNPVLDARYQIEWAFALAAGEDLDRVFFQTPLYSYLLAAWLRAFGWSVWAIVTIHMILGVGVLVMVLALLRHFRVGPRLTYATLAFTALYPLFPFYAAMLHKTALEIFLHVLVLLLGVKVVAGAGTWREQALALGLGLAWGLTALVRATFAALVMLIPCVLGRRRVLTSALVVAGFLPLILWAMLHNHRGTGEWGLLSTSFGLTLYHGNNSSNPEGRVVEAPGVSGKPRREEESGRALAERTLGRRLTHWEVNRFFVNRVLAFMREEPRIFWKAQLFKIYWYAHREELPDNECYACVVADTVLLKYAILDWRWVVVFILPALAGLLLAWARARRVASDELFLVLYAIGLAVTVLTFYVSSRYRIGHVPVWIVLVAVGLDRGIALVGRASGGWRRPATWLLLGLLLLPGVWMAGKPLPRYSPDLWTVRVVLLYLDLGRFDRAAEAAEGLQRPEGRRRMLQYVEEHRRNKTRGSHLLGSVIPPRIP